MVSRNLLVYTTLALLIMGSLYFALDNLNELVMTIGLTVLLFMLYHFQDTMEMITDAYTLYCITCLTEAGASHNLKLPNEMPEGSYQYQAVVNYDVEGNLLQLVQIDRYGDGDLFYLALKPIPKVRDPIDIAALARKYNPIWATFDPNIEKFSVPQTRGLAKYYGWRSMSREEQFQYALKQLGIKMTEDSPIPVKKGLFKKG